MKIGIIGAGWLGLSIKKKIDNSNDTCIATRVTTKKEEENIYQFKIGTELPSEFLEMDKIIIAVPPRLRRKTPEEQLEIVSTYRNLLNQLNKNQHIIYTSSTSVYAIDGIIDENSPCEGPLYQIENIIRDSFTNNLILRLGGLAGPNRPIVNIISKKGVLNSYNAPTNLLHLKDAVEVILLSLHKNIIGTYNICSPEHPDKWTVYNKWINTLQLDPITKGLPTDKHKTVDSALFINKYSYKYFFTTPNEFDL